MDDIFSTKAMDAADQKRISNPIDLASYERGDQGIIKRNSQPEPPTPPQMAPSEPSPNRNSHGAGYSNNQIVATQPERPAYGAPAVIQEPESCKLCTVM